MKEFKVGGRVTISEDESYRIIDIIKHNGKTYYFSCTEQRPIRPKIFERVEKNGEVYIVMVEDQALIKEISEEVISSSYYNENLRKIKETNLIGKY